MPSRPRSALRSVSPSPLRLAWRVAVFCLLLLSFGAGGSAAAPIKIMPLGDSITSGLVVPGGYRSKLYQNLINAGYHFKFVGTSEDDATEALVAAGQAHHQGYGGVLIQPVADNLADGANFLGADPDIILLLLGTNDFGADEDTPNAKNRLDYLISVITSNRPNCRVIVANLILRTVPTTNIWNTIQTQFNPFISGIVSNHFALGEKVYFVDMASLLTPADLYDGLHPNHAGYTKLADAWFQTIQAVLPPDTNAPTITQARDGAGLTNVVVSFSKPVTDISAAVTNFSLNGGVTVLNATLNTNNYLDIQLHTTPLASGTTYTVTVNNVTDRTTNHTAIAADSTASFVAGATASGAAANVPEAAHYTLVYSLDIPDSADFNASGVPYSVDNRATITGPFSRIAYYLELQKSGEPLQYVYVSMDAFTTSVGKIGVPTTEISLIFQQGVSNMNVFSSVPGIVTGTGLAGGWLEFWPSSYNSTNEAGAPNASDNVLDWGDGGASTLPGQGSMQVHNTAASQVLLAYNGWGSGGASSLGLGSQTGGNGNPDWSYSANATAYSLKRLQVLVLEPLRPLLRLGFNEGGGTTTQNRGTTGGAFELTSPIPAWSANVPTNVGGISAVDFDLTPGGFAVDSAAPIPALGGLTQFTLTGWINNKSYVQGRGGNRIFSALGADNGGIELLYKGDGSLLLNIDEQVGTDAPRSSPGMIPDDLLGPNDNWRFFAVTYEMTNGQVKFYFGSQTDDATLNVTRTYSGHGAVEPATARVAIGHVNPERRSAGDNRMFRGLIDDVNLFDRVLSAAEVVQVQRGALIPFPKLTVTTFNPASGVSVAVSPNDNNDQGDGSAPFTRVYSNSVSVTLTAPATGGTNSFLRWKRDGADYGTNLTVTVQMDSDHALQAVYGDLGPRTLTVNALNSSNGVPIVVSLADTNGLGDGVTPFVRHYATPTAVTLTAPLGSGTNEFLKWQLDGVDYQNSRTTTVSLEQNQALTAVYAPPPGERTLSVASTNPVSGVSITVNPIDNNGAGSGGTIFTRTYSNNVIVTLTAPLTAGQNNFQKWQRNGTNYSTGPTTSIIMNADASMLAVYAPPPFAGVMLESLNPSNGVSIGVSPADTNGLTSGTTPFTRTFSNGTVLTLTAPFNVGSNTFQKWQRDGVDFSSYPTLTIPLDGNRALTAVYGATVTPIVYLPFNENVGTTTTNRGTAGGVYTLTTPLPSWWTNSLPSVGGASALDFGAGSGLHAVDGPAPIPALGGLTQLTICGWVNCRSLVQKYIGNVIVSWLDASGANGVELVYKSDGSLMFSVNSGINDTTPRSSPARLLEDIAGGAANWRFFAVTYDSVPGRVAFYFGANGSDASLDFAKETYFQGALPPPVARLSVGNLNPERRTMDTRIFRGVIDQIAIFGQVLTPTEIINVQRETLVATPFQSVSNCPGTSVTFATAASGGGPFAFQWSKDGTPIDDATNNSFSIAAVGPSDAGTYCVRVDGFYNSETRCATLTVHTPVTVMGPHALVQCPGTTATFSATPSGTGPFTYVWRKDGAVIAGVTNNSCSIAGVTAASAGTYCVEVTGACNSVTNCATLTVLTNTTATAPMSLVDCPGTSAAFSTVAAGTGPFSYQWTKDGVAIPGATSDSHVIPAVTAADAGMYCVIVTGACNNVTNCATLTVNENVTAVGPFSRTNCFATAATFSTLPSGTGPFSFLWRKDGAVIPGATSSSLTLGAVSATDAGTYSVEIHGLCSSVTNHAALVVTEKTTATELTSLTNCPGAAASFATVVSGTGPFTYVWRKDGVLIAGANASSFALGSVTHEDAGHYCVEVTGACNTATNCATLTVLTNVSATPVVSLTNCPGTRAELATVATGTGPITYRWLKDGAAIAGATNSALGLSNVTAADAGDYCVEVIGLCSSVTNCASLTVNEVTTATALTSLTNCPGTTATFGTVPSGTGPFTYVWRRNGAVVSNATNSSLSIAAVNASDAGDYCVEVTGACDSVTNCATLTVWENVTATGPFARTDCPGTTATFNTVVAGTGPFTYQWSKDGVAIPGATASFYTVANVTAADVGTYCVEATGFCTRVTQCATLTVNVPTTAIGPVSLTNCPGTTATLTTVPSGTGPFTFVWRKNGLLIPAATTNSLSIPAVTASDAAVFTVEVTGNCNSVTNQATLTVLTNTSATDLTSVTVCPGEGAAFSTLATGTGPFAYQWKKNGTPIEDATNSSYALASCTASDATTYCVEVTGACGTVTRCTTLTVREVLTADGPFSMFNCPGSDAAFATVASGTGPFTYQWRKDGEVIPGATNAAHLISNVGPADAGSYCVEINGPCNSVTNCATLNVLTPVSAVGPTAQINCPGTTATFVTTPFGSGPFTYVWRKNGAVIPGANGRIYSIPSVAAAAAGTYCVEITGVCSSVTNCTTLTVLEGTAVTGPDSLTNCPGSTAIFNTLASGTGPFVYQWRKNGADIPGANTNVFQIASVNALDAGSYSVVVQGTCGSVTNVATLIVLTNTGATPLTSLTNCPGTAASFSIVASGTGPFTYRWTHNGSAIAGAAGPTYSITAVGAADAGVYCVEVTGACAAVTNCATLVVLTNTTATSIASVTVCPGNNASFSTLASGTGPFTYQWSKNGAPIPGATNASFSISGASAADEASYCVEVTGFCNRVTHCATLTVLTNTAATPLVSLTNCVGTMATFATVASGSGPFIYQWTKNGTPILDATNSAFSIATVALADAGAYCVEVTGACNSVTNCATLAVFERTTATAFASLTNCPGTTASFSTTPAGTGPFSYRWTKDGVAIPGATTSTHSIPSVGAANAGAYCVEVTGACNSVTNCAVLTVNVPTTASVPPPVIACLGEAAFFETEPFGTGPFTYEWRKNGVALLGATNNTLTIPAVVSADAGTYSVVVNGVCNSVTNAATLTVLLPTTATAPVSLMRCPGSAATFSTTPSGSGPFSYIWRKNGIIISGATDRTYTIQSVTAADAGTYCVQVNGVCNSVTNCATLGVLVSVAATQLMPLTNCPGTPATFETVGTGTGPLTFQWRKDGVNIPGATESAYNLPAVSAADAGTYCVVVSGICGSVTNCAPLTVLTPLSATTPASSTNCPGSAVTFSTLVTGSGPLRYQWEKDHTPIAGATNSSLTLGSVAQADAGTYCVEIAGPCNTVTNCATLTVLTNTTATELVAMTVCPGSSASFSTVASGTGPLRYQWTKDGAPIAGATNDTYTIPSASAVEAGMYCVEVTGVCNSVTRCAALTVLTNTTLAGPDSLTNCPGTSAMFTAVPSGTGPFSYQWSKNGTNINGATNGSYAVAGVTAADAATYCVVVNGFCNSVSNCATLTVNERITATPFGSRFECLGSSVTFSTVASGTGPIRYQWSRNGVPIPDATNSSYAKVGITAADAGTYSVVVSGACNSVTNSGTLTLFTSTTAIGPSSLLTCPGASETLSTIPVGSGPFTFQWRRNGVIIPGATNAFYFIPIVASSDAGSYCVEVNGLCNSVTNCAFMTVASPTTATIPVSRILCPGSSALFSTEPGGSGPFTYRWLKDGTAIPGATNSSYSIGAVTAADAGTYCIEVAGVCNSVTQCATLTVQETTTATAPPPQTNCPGTSVTFATVTSGTGPHQFQWRHNGVAIPGATGNSLNLASVTAAEAGTYCVEVGGACNSVTNCTTLSVLERVTLARLAPLTNCPGTAASFTVTPSGTGPFSYRWLKNGTPVAGATQPTLSLASVTAGDAGDYCVEVSGACDSATNCVTLTVLESTTASPLVSQTNCLGATATFTTGASGSGPFTYRWTKDGATIPGAVGNSYTISPLTDADAGNYCVEVAGVCNTVTQCATLTVNQPVTATGPSARTNCAGTTATFVTAVSGTGPFTYQWFKDDAPIPGATNSAFTLASVTAGDAGTYCVLVNGFCNSVSNCATLTVNERITATPFASRFECPGASVDFSTVASGTGPIQYQWSRNGVPIPDATNSSYVKVGITAADAGTYSVVVSGACSSVTNSGTLTVFTTTTALGPSSRLTCPGASETLSTIPLGTGPFTFQWRRNGMILPGATNAQYSIPVVALADAGTYCVEVNGLCNSVTNCALVTVASPTTATTPTSLDLCPGSPAVFSTEPAGSGPFTYRWLKNGAPIPGATNSSHSIAAVAAADAGTYCLEVTGVCNSVTRCATLTVREVTTATTPPPQTNCPGTTVTFSTAASGTGPHQYQWKHNGVAIPGAIGNSLTLESVTAADAGAYCVEVAGACNAVTNCATLTVLERLTLAGPVSLTNCPGTAASFTVTPSGSGPFTYRWLKDGTPVPGAVESTLALASVTATDAGDYCVEVSGPCNTATNCATLTVLERTTASPLVSLTNCPGAMATFTTTASGTGPFTYRWTKDGVTIPGVVGDSYSISPVTAADAGTYCVEVAGACNTVTNCAILTVNQPVTATGPSPRTNCPGTTATFTTVAAGTGPFTYQWFKDDAPISGATNSALMLASVTTADAGTYSVQIAGACNSVTQTATLRVNEPTTATGLNSLTNCTGSSAAFVTTASGTGPFTYRWKKNGVVIPGATASALTILSVAAADAGTYCVEVTGACNSVTNCATLEVLASTTATGPQNATNCVGTAAVLSTVASGAGPFTYQWKKDGNPIASAIGSSLTIPAVSLADAGTYCVEVTGRCNSTTNCATLFVRGLNTANGPESVTNCSGEPVALTTSVSAIDPVQYQWRRNGTLLPEATNATYAIASLSPTDAGSYCVEIIGSCNRLTNCATVTVRELTVATALASLTNCPGSPATFVTLASGTGPFTYRWMKDGVPLPGATYESITISSVTAADVGEYCVEVIGACNRVTNCATLALYEAITAVGPESRTNCTGTPVSLTTTASGSGPFYYQWTKDGNPITGATNHTYEIAALTLNDAGVYCAEIHGACGSVTNCATLTVHEVTLASGPNSLTNCPGTSANFATVVAGTGPFVYRWLKDGTPIAGATNSSFSINAVTAADAGDYCVEVTGACGSITQCASLTVLAPTLAAGPVSRTNCLGFPVTLTTLASGAGPFRYQWLKDGVPIAEATNNSYSIASVTTGDDGTYCVEVSGACNSVTNCAILTVNEAVTASELVSLTTCPGGSAEFSTVASGSGPFRYRWTRNGVDVPGATNAALIIPSVSAGDAGTYCIEIGGACNSVTNCATLTVLEPTTAVGPGSLTNCPGTAALLATTASGSGPFAYQWSKNAVPIDGATNASLSLAAVTAGDAGSYCVEVSGTCNRVTNCATLTLMEAASATALTSLTNCPGSAASFATVASGSGPFRYQWSKDGIVIPNATNATFDLLSVTAADAGLYCVQVAGLCNTVSQCATLTVFEPTIVGALTSRTNCPGTAVSFDAVVTGTGPFQYQWLKDGAALPGETNGALAIPSITLGDAGSYCVIVAGACGRATNCATLTVNELTAATELRSLTNCAGSSATFITVATGAGPFRYRWTKDDVELVGATNNSLILAAVTASDAGTYCVEVAGACQSVTRCATLTVHEPTVASPLASLTRCVGSSAVFATVASGTGPFTCRWTKDGAPVAGATNATLTLASLSAADAGTYCVEVTGACNSVSQCATLAVNALTTASGPAPQTNCAGSSAVLSTVASGAGPFSYQWSKDGVPIPGATNASHSIASVTAADAGEYCVAVAGACNSVTNCARLTLHEMTTATALVPLTNCLGSSAVFSTVAAGAGPFRYRWTKDGTPIPGATNSSVSVNPVTALSAGTYCVEVTGACDSVTRCATLTVHELTSATAPASLTNCAGSSAAFSTVAMGTGPFSYQWMKSGAPIPGATNAAFAIASVALADAGTYCVEVTGACDSATRCANLTVHAATSASPLADTSRTAGESVTFSTTASGAAPLTFVWLKDGGVLAGKSESSLTLSNLALADSGTYCVVVSSACGSMTNCATLTVHPLMHSVTVAPMPATGGSATGGGSVPDGASVTVVATANPGYAFVAWMESGQEVSKASSYSFSAVTNRSLLAEFTSSRPTPIVHLALNENGGAQTTNQGSAGGLFTLTPTVPQWITETPVAVGGASSVDFPGNLGDYGVDSAAPISELGGLARFTITGWLNNRDQSQGSGGNRIVSWFDGDTSGVELVYRGDGSLILSVNELPSSARSSAGKITTDFVAPPENWRFFAVTYDSATGDVAFYFGSNTNDASLDKVVSYTERGPVGPATGRLTIGHVNPERRPDMLTRVFRGLIDDVQIFGRVLSASDIVAVQRGVGSEPPNAPSVIRIGQDGGQVRLRVFGQVGRTYRVLCCPAIGAGWTAIATNTVDASGSFEVIDAEAGQPTRFYKAVSP